jgi:hypothetical protein
MHGPQLEFSTAGLSTNRRKDMDGQLLACELSTATLTRTGMPASAGGVVLGLYALYQQIRARYRVAMVSVSRTRYVNRHWLKG